MYDLLLPTIAIGLVVSPYDERGALLYVLVASQANTIADWAYITVGYFAFLLYRVLTNAVKG